MSLKSKNALFCGEITENSKSLIEAILEQNIKTLLISNTKRDCIERLGLVDTRLSHYTGNLTKIEDLEVIYSEALKRSKKKVHIVVNHKELSANDAWEEVITTHINAMICSTLMAIKHLGSMNAGCGGTVVNSMVVTGRTDDEYASIHRLLNDLDRSFSDPYYFNNTAVRILTMCTRMEIGQGSDRCAPPASSTAEVAVEANVSEEADTPSGADVSLAERLEIVGMLLDVFANKRSALDPPASKHVEEFEISIRN